MAYINMIPVDGTVVIDGIAAFGVNFSGIDPTIHAIAWYGVLGEVEYVYNPLTREKPPNLQITSIAPYQDYVNQANEIIYAAQNPEIYYSTISDYAWQGNEFPLGSEIVVSTPNTPQPPNTTVNVPPTCETYQRLYWYGSAWVCSSIDPSLPLVTAKQDLITQMESEAAFHVNVQARIYSSLQLIEAADPGALLCADYPSYTLDAYQTSMNTQVANLTTVVNAATTAPQLYGFDPRINGNPA